MARIIGVHHIPDRSKLIRTGRLVGMTSGLLLEGFCVMWLGTGLLGIKGMWAKEMLQMLNYGLLCMG